MWQNFSCVNKNFETWLKCAYGLRINQTSLSINLYSESLVITYEYPFLSCKLSNYIHTSKMSVSSVLNYILLKKSILKNNEESKLKKVNVRFLNLF